MSTKNLARTLIEGGRSGYNKAERRHSHGVERSLLRAYLKRVGALPDGFDAVPVGKRPRVYRDFADKLGAPRRWLHSHVGKPWDKVRAKMFERFDPRSLAGQHIIYDHLLQEVQLWGDEQPRWSRWDRLYVDAQGILRALPQRRRKPARKSRTNGPPPSAAEVELWAAGRRVGTRGTRLYWFVRARSYPVARGEAEPCERLRQDRALTLDEREFWERLTEHDQRRYELQV